MMTAPRSAAQRITAARFRADRTEPVGHWCEGVRITASAPLSRSRSTRMPLASTGIPITSRPAARAAGRASSREDGSSSASRRGYALTLTAAGRQHLDAAGHAVRDRLAERLTDWDDRDIEAFAGLVIRFNLGSSRL